MKNLLLGSDFHGSYSAQPGGQVGGSGNVGVPTGRGPPPLGGIQTLGQSAAGIPPGGPGQPSQASTPGVQNQGQPTPTTTPPVVPPSQDMGKQGHLSTQPPSLQQVYVPAQNRPTSQVRSYRRKNDPKCSLKINK